MTNIYLSNLLMSLADMEEKEGQLGLGSEQYKFRTKRWVSITRYPAISLLTNQRSWKKYTDFQTELSQTITITEINLT